MNNIKMKTSDNYIVKDGKAIKLKENEVPKNGYIFYFFGNVKGGNNSYGSAEKRHYIFSSSKIK